MKNMMMTMFRCSKSMKMMLGVCIFMIAVCCSCLSAGRSSSAGIGKRQAPASTPIDNLTEEEIMDNLKKLVNLFSEMVENEGNGRWKNIALGPKAFELMRDSLPLRVKGELTPYTRIVLLGQMMGTMPERDCARFFMQVKEYQKSMFPLISSEDLAEDMDIDGYEGDPEMYVRQFTLQVLEAGIRRTAEYLDTNVPMEEWCDRYGVWLKFDPVERTEKWEKCIYEVEKECDRKLRNESRGMGFCHSYWSTKRAVLAKHGIKWSSPSMMNPGVMFD